ncbi:MAG TPA: hypothetical protein PK514_02970 [Spirochaetota bacterium]|nr:hypothetical protein [Spirochaetota bacterium]
MAFVRIEGFRGLVFVPEKTSSPKKHACADCFECAYCSDERCKLCLKKKSRKKNDVGNDGKTG